MRKCGVHNRRVGVAENQFPNGNARKQAGFSEKTIVGGSLQPEQRVQFPGILGEPRKNAVVPVEEACGYQTVSVVAKNIGNAGEQPTAPHGGNPEAGPRATSRAVHL